MKKLILSLSLPSFLFVGCFLGPVTPGSYYYRVERTVEPGATCPVGYPIDCGGYCCPSGTTCYASGASGGRCQYEPVANAPEPGDVGDTCQVDADCYSDLICGEDVDGTRCRGR